MGAFRRTTTWLALLAGACMGLVAGARADVPGRPARAPLTLQELAPDVLLVQGAGGNVVALTAPEGVLLVDGGSRERSAELLRLISSRTGGRPVRTLVNTHWHWDHTGSNEAVAQAGGSILAHENTRLWLGSEVISRWEDRTYPARPKGALPTETFFYGSKKLSFGPHEIELLFLPQAHTDGDVAVLLPKQDIVIAGDVVTGGSYPIFDYSTNGWSGGMVEGLRALLPRLSPQTRIVPGAGNVRTRADVQAQLDMVLAVTQRIGESYYKGQTWDELLASQPTKEFDARWGAPELFLKTAYQGAWQHITEIRRVR